MKKKKRLWIYSSVAVVVAVLGTAVYLGSKENSDYVNAAKRLPEAKQRAKEVFGALSWEEYRKQRGIVYRDDTVAWERVVDSIPAGIDKLMQRGPPAPHDCEAEFRKNRSWFLGLRSEISDLDFQHDEGDDGFISAFNALSLVEALMLGLIGAAEAGDIDSMIELADTANEITSKLTAEPEFFCRLMMNLNAAILNDAKLSIAIRDRDKPEILNAVYESHLARTKLPTFAEVVSGDARDNFHLLEEVRSLNPDELDTWLDEQSLYSPFMQDTLGNTVFEAARGVGFLKSKYGRKMGANSSAALEARYWESMTDLMSVLGDSGDTIYVNQQEIVDLNDKLVAQKDLSYELAQIFSSLGTYSLKYMFDHVQEDELMRYIEFAAIELVCRFPEYALIPEELPSDISYVEFYGGGDLLYRKTATGFVIYSRYKNQFDDGFLPAFPGQLDHDGYQHVKSMGDADYGLSVSYPAVL